MAQYRQGTVAITNNSQVVTGTGTYWLANVQPGNLFTVVGSSVTYEVASVDSDTQIKLSAPYAGQTATAQSYVISQSATPVSGIPYPERGDVETATILKRALLQLDSDAPASKVMFSDLYTDFKVSGLLPAVPSPASLIMTTPAGAAYVGGLRVVKADTTYTYPASSDVYVDLSSKGVFTYLAVANGAAAPAVTANSLRLFKVVTDVGAVTAVTLLAASKPVVGHTIDAGNVNYAGSANLAATTVEAALDELDVEKAGLSLANTFTQPQTIPAGTAADHAATKGQVDAVQTNLNAHTGAATAHGSTSAATASAIMQRDSAGRAKVAAPAAADDIARKDTVDAVQTNLNAHTGAATAHGSTSAATASAIMQRDSAGRAKVAAPAAADDIARKDTVDAVQTNLNAHTGAATGAHAASAISYTPAGNLAATDVAAALNELDAEKSGLGLANSFTQPQTAPQFNVGDANARIKRTPDGHTQIEATQASLISAGLVQSQQAANALWDGTNWNRIDTAQPASLQVVDRSGTLSFYTAPAGANPIAWSGPYPVMRGGMSHATATLSANQSVAAATFTKVAFATEGVDVLGNYDPALYRFTAPELGIYDVSASALFRGNADGVRSLLTIYYNGGEARRGADTVQGAASDVTATVSCAMRLAAGDYVEAFVYCSAAATLLANGGTTWLSISRVQ